MLTKNDLVKIGQVVDQRLDRKLDEKLSNYPTKKDLDARLDEKLSKSLEPIKRDLRKIRKDLKTTIDFFDNAHLRLKKRVKRIENHLDLPPIPITLN